MDDRAIERALRAAPGPAFRAGHESRLEARLDARQGATLRRHAKSWRAVAALVALVGAVWLVVARSDDRPQATARVTAVPVYWSRDGAAARLDISRWTCDGCVTESSERPMRREGARP
ncbi:MAG: hypothetical protein GC172_09790 [Phycisphaera sp.]|nr:hypothetical protein [Phycisphaera sp.]